jgi:hypothetical protein
MQMEDATDAPAEAGPSIPMPTGTRTINRLDIVANNMSQSDQGSHTLWPCLFMSISRCTRNTNMVAPNADVMLAIFAKVAPSGFIKFSVSMSKAFPASSAWWGRCSRLN